SNSRNSNILTVVVFTIIACLSAMADSHVRIVRLSYIEGGVQISHGAAGAYEKAIVNLPITEGAKLKTADGRAEVEFEDGSTLRIVADSTVEFSQLSLRDSGAKVSELKITSGTAYVNFTGTKNDEFSVRFEDKKIMLARAAHLRIVLGDEDSSVAVFKGLVQVDNPSGMIDVKKNQTVAFDLDTNQYKVAKNIQETPYDSWDDQQNEYHTRYAAKSYNSYSPYAYGTTDLSYYGNFFNAPGYGMMWQPYLAGAGWDPFMDGAWAFNSGFGFGWAWQPGGAWNNWYSQPVVRNAPKSFVAPHAPVSGTSTVVVNRAPASAFTGNKLIVRNNSAGLGVPRGQFGNMAKLSQKAQQRGVVSQRVAVQPAAMPSSSSGGRTGVPSGRAGLPSRASQPTPRSQPAPRMGAPIGSSSRPSGGVSPHR
ncbi:MAG TPA: FecR family protein, partial [Terriglobales bacterium]|nr:FecR family protein [Terriglobales bacterium]